MGENVRGIINIQDGVVFETVCTDLESEGYEVQPFIIPAASVGAPHRRERVWIVAVREDVANTIGNDEGQEISRSDEETRRIQEEHRTEHSATRQSSRTSEIRKGDNGYESMANPRRALWSRGELQGENGNETREGYADQLERSSSASEFNVADTNTRLGNGENEKVQSRGQTSDSSRTRGREDVADTESIGSDVGRREQHQGERSGQRQVGGASGSTQGSQGWWLVEPNVGRVAHGVSGRVHRLKGLGNSIVPQIVEEIGKAIIKAEQE